MYVDAVFRSQRHELFHVQATIPLDARKLILSDGSSMQQLFSDVRFSSVSEDRRLTARGIGVLPFCP